MFLVRSVCYPFFLLYTVMKIIYTSVWSVCFALFKANGWLSLPRGFRARTGVHVPTAFPLFFYTWTYICDAPQVTSGCAPTSVGVRGTLSYLAVLPRFFMLHVCLHVYLYCGWLVPPPLLFWVYIVINNEQYTIIVMLFLHNTCKANDSALYI